MPLPNVFTKEVTDQMVARINTLTPESERQWGKMDVARMLAHCCVSYEMIYEPDKHPRPNVLVGLILKTVVKGKVGSDKPLKKNGPTEPQFIIKSDRDFETEKARLITFVERTQQLGETEFDGKVSTSFGKLTKTEWSNILYKHLDHHLSPFGA